MTRRIVLVALLGVAPATCAPPVASAADVFGFKPKLGQGTTKVKVKKTFETKFEAYGELSFRTRVDGVECTDSISLQRRVRDVGHKTHFSWIEIRDGLPLRRCSATPTGAKPAAERTSQKFLNDPEPYRRLLKKTPLRLRYSVTVRASGVVVYHKTLTAPVTAASLSSPFRLK
jgi:hypothetical protein